MEDRLNDRLEAFANQVAERFDAFEERLSGVETEVKSAKDLILEVLNRLPPRQEGN